MGFVGFVLGGWPRRPRMPCSLLLALAACGPGLLPLPLREQGGSIDGVCPCTQVAATTAGDGHVELFVRRDDGTLWRLWEDASGTYAPFNAQALSPSAGRGRPLVRGAPTAVSRDAVHAFYVAAPARGRGARYGALQEVTGVCAMGHPCAWTRLLRRVDHGGQVADPAAVLTADRRIQVFARASDGTIVTTAESAPGEAFSPWTSLGKPGAGAVGRSSAALMTDGRLLLAALDVDGLAWISTQTSAGAGFGPWLALGAPTPAVKGKTGVLLPLTQPPVAASNWDGRAVLFGLASNAAIYEIVQRAPGGAVWTGWRSPALIPGSFAQAGGRNGPPSVATDLDGRLELVFANTDALTAAQLWEVAQPSHSSWQGATPRFLAFAADGFAQDRIAVTREGDGRQVAFFLDSQGGLHYARQSTTVRQRPMAWFAPLPPLIVTPGRPYTGSDDFMSLFVAAAAWPIAAAHTAVFKLYGEWVRYGSTDAERAAVAADLARRGIPLALEMGPLIPDAGCGHSTEGFSGADALETAQRLRAAGADVRYVALDEPFFYAHIWSGGPDACHWDADKIAAQVRDFRDVWRGVYPAVQIGDIEPVTVDVTAQAYLDFLDAYQLAAGEPFAFLHLDITLFQGWPDVARAIEDGARLRGVPLGMIYNGRGSTDAGWIAQALALAYQYEGRPGGRPEQAIFQSWDDKPDFTLPESSPTSFTHLIDAYFRPRSYLTASLASRHVQGMLFDEGGAPLAARQVTLTLVAAGQPLAVAVRTTAGDGSFDFGPVDPLGRGVEVTFGGDDAVWPAYLRVR